MPTQITQSMVSEVSICNQALAFLGQKPITSLDQASESAVWMRNNYPFLRDALLEERMWSFALAEADSEVADRNVFRDGYVHQIPLGWIAVFRCFSSGGRNYPVEWRMDSTGIIADEAHIFMWGIKRIEDTGKFTPLFVQALAARLAADAAIPLTDNRQLQADMWALYASKLTDAAARDGMKGSNERLTSNSLIDARYSGRF